MQNKNIEERIQVNLPNIKSKPEANYKQCLQLEGCQCSVCMGKLNLKLQKFEPKQKQQNNFEEFIKQIPSNFPLSINAITVYSPQKGYYTHYYNGNKQDNKIFIYRTKVSKLLSNHPMASNIQIYGNHFSKITAKHQVLAFLKKIQEKQKHSTTSKKHHHNNNQLMTKSLIVSPEQPLLSNRNPEQRQDNNSTVLSTKFRHGKVLYIQAYTHQIPIKVYYTKEGFVSKLDNILIEYLDEQVENFHPQKIYTINEEFWNWVYGEYGQEIFAYFVTEFYCRAYEFFSKNKILQAVFYWIFQKPKSQFGENTKVTEELGKHKQILEAQYFISKAKKLGFKVKLNNIKNVSIEYHRVFRTFQEEYQDMILTKINTKSSDTSVKDKSSSVNKKNYLYQSRLDTFHSKVRDLFLKEQNKVLNQVETEKQHQGAVDSNKLARLLLPSMGEEQTIREILNDEKAFQKLVLYQEKKIEKERLRKAREKLLLERRESGRGRSNWEEKFRGNQFSQSRRVRVRTEY